MSRCDLRISRVNGGADDHDVGTFHVVRSMPVEDDCAEALQPRGHGRGPEVAAGNTIAERQQNFGDATHADSADAYEMYALQFCEHGPLDLITAGERRR